MDIDLNADLGEGIGFDADLVPLVTSANVCCGLHAGGPGEIARTLALANKQGLAIGAHPGYADRENFGRKELPVDNREVISLCVYQIGALDGAHQYTVLMVRSMLTALARKPPSLPICQTRTPAMFPKSRIRKRDKQPFRRRKR